MQEADRKCGIFSSLFIGMCELYKPITKEIHLMSDFIFMFSDIIFTAHH